MPERFVFSGNSWPPDWSKRVIRVVSAKFARAEAAFKSLSASAWVGDIF
jgi:hypothetical protein